MSRYLKYVFPVASTTDVCLTQTLIIGGNLTLNGNLANSINSQVSFIEKGYSRQVSLTSANNLSAVQFTITGTQNEVVVTENIAGPHANTVYGTNIYDVITSISANTATNAVSVGTGYLGFFPLININLERDVINYALSTARLTAGSIHTTIYNTISNINGSTTYLNLINEALSSKRF